MGRDRTIARELAEELCAKYPTHSNLGLAKKLKADHPECFATVENARSLIRTVRGATGNRWRKYATQPRPLGKAGTAPQLPPSLAEEWVPMDLGKNIRVAVLSDAHVPYHSEKALEAAVIELKSMNPNTVLINGDWSDFYQISRWQKNPKKRKFSDELKAIKESLAWLSYHFPKCRIVYKAGNHEERWNHFIWNRAPEIYDLPQMQIDELLELNNLGIEFVQDQRLVMVGKLPIAHGHELGRGIFSPVNPARGAFLRTHHTILVGHSHQTSGHADTDLFHSETFIWSTGCLCDLTPEYARVNRWNWGCAFVEVDNDGCFNVTNLRINRDGVVHS